MAPELKLPPKPKAPVGRGGVDHDKLWSCYQHLVKKKVSYREAAKLFGFPESRVHSFCTRFDLPVDHIVKRTNVGGYHIARRRPGTDLNLKSRSVS